jgi:predicted ATP-binding protein involved in virulence
MAAPANHRSRKDTSFYTKGIRVLARSFSGADPDIIDRMLPEDLFYYSYLGAINLFTAFFLGLAYIKLARILLDTNSVANIIVAILIIIAVLFIMRVLGKLIINRRSSAGRIIYALLLLLAAGTVWLWSFISFTDEKRKDKANETVKVQQTLQSYRYAILNIEKSPVAGSYWLVDSALNYTDSFLIVANAKAILSPSPMTNQLLRLSFIRNESRNSLDSVDKLAKLDDYEKAALRKLLTDFTNTSAHIMDGIISDFDAEKKFASLSVRQKISVLSEEGTTGIMLKSFLSALPILTFLFFLWLPQGYKGRNFYYKLLDERNRLNNESLKKERDKIIQEIRIQSEIKQTRTSFQEAAGDNDDLRKVADELNESLSVDNLVKAAQVQFNYRFFDKALEYINKAIELQDDKSASNPAEELRPELFEFKARILTELNDPERAKKMLDRFVELNDEKKYRSNLKREILIDRFEAENLPFFGNLRWNLKPGINILLGKNGYGKSHLLGLIIAMLYDDKIKTREWIPPTASTNCKARLYVISDHPLNTSKVEEMTASLKDQEKKINELENSSSKSSNVDITRAKTQYLNTLESLDAEQRRILASKEGTAGNIGRVPILAIPDSRFIDKSEQGFSNETAASDDLKKDGATEFLYARSFARIIKKGLFITAQQNSTDFKKTPYDLIERIISELAGSGGDSPFFKFDHIELNSTTGDYKFYVRSEDNDQVFQLQQVSQGTFSVLAMVLMIYRFLSELRKESKDIFKEKTIVIIDEIDAHLHPSWEQKIIGILRREFPNVQFIITAHSPLVVAGCFDGEVAVMRHEKSKGFTLEQPTGDFIGVSTEDLFRKVFEVEDKDDTYLEYAGKIDNEPKYQSDLDNLKKKKKDGGKLSDADSKKMDELYETLNHIGSAKRMQTKRVDTSVLETQNKFLQSRVEYLQTELDYLKQKANENTLKP